LKRESLEIEALSSFSSPTYTKFHI